MKNIIFIIALSILLFSCTSYDKSANLNAEKAKLAHSKFNNINNDFSYKEYRSLIVEYGKNSKFPEIK
tara:strand:- start:712 stop:915 length:204 start_codon:yes stop_codon:yes gene_type:complete